MSASIELCGFVMHVTFILFPRDVMLSYQTCHLSLKFVWHCFCLSDQLVLLEKCGESKWKLLLGGEASPWQDSGGGRGSVHA